MSLPASNQSARAFSTYSADVHVYGADWPTWQRDLFPFTYRRDAAEIEAEVRGLRLRLSVERRVLAWAIKQRARALGYRAVVANHRKVIDRLERYCRNGETQLRLIAAGRPRLVASRSTLSDIAKPAPLRVVGGRG